MKACIIVLAMGLCSTLADDICTEFKSPSGSNKNVKIQNLEKEFIVDIEVVKKELKIVQNMRMFYSKKENIIRLDILDNQMKQQLYFYYDNNEILDFNRSPLMGRGTCSVYQDLGSAVDEFWFGGTARGTANPRIPVPLAAIHFAGMSGFSNHQINQKFIGKGDIRGKKTTQYTSCQKWTSSSSDIVLNVTHSFAEMDYKVPYAGDRYSTLLSMEVTGTGKINGQENTIDHVYNYFNFRGFEEDDTRLETPEGIVCNGRKHDKRKTFPKLPNFIKFTGEVISKADKKFVAKEEVYDYYHKFAIVKSIDKLDSTADMNRKTLVFDFAVNKLFIIDKVQTSCQRKNISDIDKIADLFTIKRGQAMMQGPTNFFMADPKDFAYLGQKLVRGMVTDTWVAPSDIKSKAVVQFHIAPEVKSWNDGVPSYQLEKWAVPVKIKVWQNALTRDSQVENIFHVDYNAIRSDYIDMAPCYQHSYHMQIVLKGMRESIVNSFEELFSYKVKSYLAQEAGVSFHQINRFKVFYMKGDLINLEFMIGAMDPDVLESSVNKITDGLKFGKLVLKARQPGTDNWNKPLPFVKVSKVKSAETSPRVSVSKDSGYSKGALAGLGVGMILLGLAGGVGAGVAHGKFFG